VKEQNRSARRARSGLAVAVFLGSVAVCATSAPAAGLLIAEGGLGGALEIEEHSVEVTVENGIAVTEVTQVFRNLEDRIVEALYTFPVPRGASVSNFSMWIQGKEMVGEVVEKKRAREIYDSYKARRIDPGLLEQADFRSFEMRIFPIGPRAEQRVQVTYYQELDADDDWVTYVYPLATSTRREVASRTRGKFALSARLRSVVPIAKVESPSHGDDFAFAHRNETFAEASLETSGGDLSRDVVLAYRLSKPVTGADIVTSKPAGEDGYFCLVLTPGDELAAGDKGMDFVFVLDVSGSMERDGKLDLSRGSVDAFLRELEPEDRLELITFHISPSTLFGELVTPTEQNISQAAGYLRTQEARGGTNLAPAIRTAFKYAAAGRPLNVVVLSDGLTEGQDLAALIGLMESRPAGSRVFAIGIGNDVNRKNLEDAAGKAGGLAAFVSRGDDMSRQARAFRRKLTRAALENVTVEIDGVKTYDIEPARPVNLFHGTPSRVYGRYDGSGPAKVRLRGGSSEAPFDRTFEVEFRPEGSSRPEIERMWAWRRADRLQKANAGPSEIEEIVELGERFSIVTEHTSFLVLENDGEYRRWRIERRNLDRTARDRKARQELIAQLEKMRARSLEDIGPLGAAAPAPAPVASSQPPAAPIPTVPAEPAPPPPRRPMIDFPDMGGGPVGPLFVGVAGWLAWRKRRAAARAA
jgi:Ca-activated chloride channel family protein